MDSTQIIINIIGAIMLITLCVLLFLLRSRVNRALDSILIPEKNISLQNLVEDYLKRVSALENKVTHVESEVQNHAVRLDEKLGKVGFMRFNPYGDTGGDQSFCIALLDDKNNGVVITTLYRRGDTQTFSKKVENGKSESNLTAEEQETLNIALNKK